MVCTQLAIGQTFSLREIKGLSTREIYNLHTDKNGFLWIAHSLGLSRYDGKNFTHFNNSHKNSLSVFDLLEDPQGRIWCHDLSGQVFYVENEKMHFYKDYVHADESKYQRMVMAGSYLLASSVKGLFILDTRNLQSKYIGLPGNEIPKISSIALVGNKVLLTGQRIFSYDISKPGEFLTTEVVQKLPFDGLHMVVQPESLHDTAFIIEQRFGVIYKLTVHDDKFVLVGKEMIGEFINTLSIVDDVVYVNTKNYSRSLHGNNKIEGFNISDIELDNEGNTWVSSLEKGLFVHYEQQWQPFPITNTLSTENITRIATSKSYHIYGLNQPKLIFVNRNVPSKTFTIPIPGGVGSIEYLKVFEDEHLFVGCTVGLYWVDINNQKVHKLPIDIAVKDIKRVKNSYLIAGAIGLISLTETKEENVPFLTKTLALKRARSVLVDPVTNKITAAFHDGLYTLEKDDRWQPVLYNHKNIMASYINSFNGKTYIATYNDGLLICDKKDTVALTIINGLNSNTILGCRYFEQHLWLMGAGQIQVIDLLEDKICKHINIPVLTTHLVNDIDERENSIVIATPEGLFSTPRIPPQTFIPNSFVIRVKVDGIDTLSVDPHFNYNSSLQFYISFPLFSSQEKIIYKYRLTGNITSSWSYLYNGDNNFHFPALAPGKYQLEVFALHPSILANELKMTYAFTILPPWYATWWFRLLIVSIITLALFGLYKYRIYQLTRVEVFRRKLSGNLHDDIGSTLSGINIYSELAKKEKDNIGYLDTIQNQTQLVISKLDDLVWFINPKNDSLENLVERMKDFGIPLLKAKNIAVDFTVNDDDSITRMSPDLRTHLFLAFKELVNNIVKHSSANHCVIHINIYHKRFTIEVVDNGIGFDASKISRHRNGLFNLAERAKEHKGQFHINSTPFVGTTATFSLKQ